MSERDERDFKPGSKVLRMGADAPSFGLYQFGQYEVESWNPKTADGLVLKGIEGRWNSQNFELFGNQFPA